jgi:hypothetical protein
MKSFGRVTGDFGTAIAQDVRKVGELPLSLFNRSGVKSAESDRSEISALFASLRLFGLFPLVAAPPRCLHLRHLR